MNGVISAMLRDRGASIVRFIDVSHLPAEQTRRLTSAIVFCHALAREDIAAMRGGEKDALAVILAREGEADAAADWLAGYLRDRGYGAYAQSTGNVMRDDRYDSERLTSALPNKTLARLAGIGFIGKNNLLVTEEHGCAGHVRRPDRRARDGGAPPRAPVAVRPVRDLPGRLSGGRHPRRGMDGRRRTRRRRRHSKVSPQM